jgi:hypothetical protein
MDRSLSGSHLDAILCLMARLRAKLLPAIILIAAIFCSQVACLLPRSALTSENSSLVDLNPIDVDRKHPESRLGRVGSHKRFSFVVQGQTVRRLVGLVNWQRRQTLRNLGQWLLADGQNGLGSK